MNFEITAIYLSMSALLMLVLAYRVTAYRRKFKVGLGDGDRPEFSVAIRAHANLVEYAPITMFLLFIAESLNVSSLLLHICGMVFILSRIAHAWGYTVAAGGYSLFRIYGIAANWLVMLMLVACNLYMVFLKSVF